MILEQDVSGQPFLVFLIMGEAAQEFSHMFDKDIVNVGDGVEPPVDLIGILFCCHQWELYGMHYADGETSFVRKGEPKKEKLDSGSIRRSHIIKKK